MIYIVGVRVYFSDFGSMNRMSQVTTIRVPSIDKNDPGSDSSMQNIRGKPCIYFG